MDSAESSPSVDDFHVSLIDLVSNHQIIYNHFHPEHKNRQAVENRWRVIASQLNTTGM